MGILKKTEAQNPEKEGRALDRLRFYCVEMHEPSKKVAKLMPETLLRPHQYLVESEKSKLADGVSEEVARLFVSDLVEQADILEKPTFWLKPSDEKIAAIKKYNATVEKQEDRTEALNNLASSLTCLDKDELNGILVAENADIKIAFEYNPETNQIKFRLKTSKGNLGEFDGKKVEETRVIIAGRTKNQEPNIQISLLEAGESKNKLMELRLGVTRGKGGKTNGALACIKVGGRTLGSKRLETLSDPKTLNEDFRTIRENLLLNFLGIIGEVDDEKFTTKPGYKITRGGGRENKHNMAEKEIFKIVKSLGEVPKKRIQRKPWYEILDGKRYERAIIGNETNGRTKLSKKETAALKDLEEIVRQKITDSLNGSPATKNLLGEIMAQNGSKEASPNKPLEWVVGKIPKDSMERAHIMLTMHEMLVENQIPEEFQKISVNLSDLLRQAGLTKSDYDNMKLKKMGELERKRNRKGEKDVLDDVLLDMLMVFKLLSINLSPNSNEDSNEKHKETV